MKDNYCFEKVKVVIWDLDETFWQGTLSEGSVIPFANRIELINRLLDLGIVNSICSKNDFTEVKSKLEELEIFDLFVFPSISWEAKGQRVSALLQDMALRAENALFVDDNESNLNEVQYHNPTIMTMLPEGVDDFFAWVMQQPVTDKNRSRHQRYQILQEKHQDRKNVGSNEDFLVQSGIEVLIKNDCLSEFERIFELIQRTNQLNYTKKRISKEELQQLLAQTDVQSGYVQVRDNYGDYGIVGFYAVIYGQLEHFLFSCRTLGMGVEQFVFNKLNHPQLDVIGEVAVMVNTDNNPHWIKEVDHFDPKTKEQDATVSRCRVLMKGPCDMMQLFSYIDEKDASIDWEFTYVGEKGNGIEQHNHTECIRTAKSISAARTKEIAAELPFGDKEMYSAKIFSNNYDIVFLSMLTDGGLGMYKRKATGEMIAFGQYIYPLTEQAYWDDFVSGKLPLSDVKITYKDLQEFSEKYTFEGRITPERILNNIEFIRRNLPASTLLVLLLGTELPFEKNKLKNYEDRAEFHRAVNQKLRVYAAQESNVGIIDFGEFVKKQTDYFNNINHFIKPVYYQVSGEMIKIINQHTATSVRTKNLGKAYLSYLRQIVFKLFGLDKFNR